MFEGIQEKVNQAVDSLRTWVDHDVQRGNRMETLLQEIRENNRNHSIETYGTALSRSTYAVSDGATVTEAYLGPKPNRTWILRHIGVSIDGATANWPVAIYLEDTTRPITVIEVYGTATSGLGYTGRQTVDIPVPGGMRVYARFLNFAGPLAANFTCRLHVLGLEIPNPGVKLHYVEKDEAHGQPEGRPSEAKVNFGQPTVPEPQGTGVDIAAAIPSLPDGLNGAPRGKPAVKVATPDPPSPSREYGQDQ